MCEANAYLTEDGEHRLLMERVDTAVPEEDGVRLTNIYGDRLFVRAKIHSLSLVDHKIFLEP